MNYNILTSESSKKNPSDNIQSLTINWLRFPLAIAVVYIHNFGIKPIDLYRLHANPTSSESIYNLIRIIFSNVATSFAVPAFFLFSGYFFFYKLKYMNSEFFCQNLRKRYYSLCVPYILWITIEVFRVELLRIGGVIFKGRPLLQIWQYIEENHGLHIFWDCCNCGYYINWLGLNIPSSAPILIQLWFIRDLIIVVVFSPLLYLCIKKIKIYFLFILGICYISNTFIPINGFSSVSFFWFSLGAYLSINEKNMVETLFRYRNISIAISITLLIPLVWLNANGWDGIISQHFVKAMHNIYTIFAVVSIIGITATLIKSDYISVNNKLSKASFFIFLSHPFILRLIHFFFGNFIAKNNYILQSFGYMLRPIATVVICLFIYEFMNRFTPKILYVLIGSRK